MALLHAEFTHCAQMTKNATGKCQLSVGRTLYESQKEKLRSYTPKKTLCMFSIACRPFRMDFYQFHFGHFWKKKHELWAMHSRLLFGWCNLLKAIECASHLSINRYAFVNRILAATAAAKATLFPCNQNEYHSFDYAVSIKTRMTNIKLRIEKDCVESVIYRHYHKDCMLLYVCACFFVWWFVSKIRVHLSRY